MKLMYCDEVRCYQKAKSTSLASCRTRYGHVMDVKRQFGSPSSYDSYFPLIADFPAVTLFVLCHACASIHMHPSRSQPV